MYKVGITGGIGSGKSKVAEFLNDRGVAIYNSDIRAKELMNGDESLRQALVAEFGAECYTHEGLNRPWLAQRVFSDKVELAKLNAIVHPAVMRDFAVWAEEQEGSYVVLESAILLEAGLEEYVDVVVAVMAPVELRLERAMLRDGASREEMKETQVRSLNQKDPRRKKWQPTPVFLPEESHGQRSLVGYSPWVAKIRTRLSD